MRQFSKKCKCQAHGAAKEKSQEILKVGRVHPLGTMNVCTKISWQKSIEQLLRFVGIKHKCPPHFGAKRKVKVSAGCILWET